MTSSGSAYARLRRVLELRSSALLIRAAAAELPGPVPLEDAFDVMLALLDLEPDSYPKLAARWTSRLAIENRLALVDAQLVLAALAVLPGPSARAGAESLIEVTSRCGLHRIDALLAAWLERRGLGE